MIFDVWHQYPPTKVVAVETGPDGKDMKFYQPAIFHRGQVEAWTAAQAIEKAKAQRLSPWPLVRRSDG